MQECKQCGTSKTPMWRSGPLGPKTLCNACGVRAQRAQQRTRTSSASVSPNKDKAGMPLPLRQGEAPSTALQQLPSKTTIRLPPKPAAQPARPLSQRWSSDAPSQAQHLFTQLPGHSVQPIRINSSIFQRLNPRQLSPCDFDSAVSPELKPVFASSSSGFQH